MKDLEKIKSEDLAAQVQDANPANFAIEQEVAQLVGATVPQPTQPSADDARELGAQLLVFLRRALLPIQTALRTAVAAIYAHLDSRCTDYTPAAYAPFQPLPSYDPMGTFVPRTLPNLLTALTAFSARKISNGSAPNDGIPDGTSLARLLGADYSAVTKLYDDTKGWVLARTITNSVFPNVTALKLGCKSATVGIVNNMPDLEELELPELDGDFVYIINGTNKVKSLYLPNAKEAKNYTAGGGGYTPIQGTEIEELIFGITSMTAVYHCRVITDCSTLKRLILPNYVNPSYSSIFSGCPNLEYVEIPNVVNISRIGYDGNQISNLPNLHTFIAGGFQQLYYSGESAETQYGSFKDCPNLIYLQAAKEINQSTNIQAWNPSAIWNDSDKVQAFLQNFREHIALRLTSNGSGKTLTLSQAVRDAIHAAEATYGIEAIIVTQKGWTLSPAPGASSQ